ncbi:zinc finger CCHC-type containing 10 [Aspergillus saccharolyticus JOP 1030-1]|uniref:Zinc knuckle-domain-containing protein n=1 Tax=Aspergillus saccharolyticus JOP 1030-1 TaxID=1450539 RepID=A0A318Z2L8_9EURO|nr:hypothetical protein BP01DRAFT_418691 [Aspergillus saccharolyticus JOP 1030-1]PYH41541.1 hypothetical protein BP01DRAFT_418691 [Aspergillus saccharolyticus JOP 1030-1]
MNRYRNAPGLRGPSKATASTLCQKCLQRGHYSYECKVTAQERPYMSRPSRTQQLQNPKLRPQLTNDAYKDALRTKEPNHETLTRHEEERGRKRDLDQVDPLHSGTHLSKRARSASSHSASSVSTISTSRSHSRSPSRRQERRRSMSSRPSSRRKRRYSDSPSTHSIASYTSGERDSRSRSREWSDDRNTRRRRRASSPEERGRPRNLSPDGGRRDRSRSHSADRSRMAKNRRSVTPPLATRSDYQDPNHRKAQSRPDPVGSGGGRGPGQQLPPPRRERSLSPYSKRIALTQAMNFGH